MSPPTVVHLGLHKTATTFLQTRFFPGLAGIRYVPLRTGRPAFLDAVLRADALEFDPARALAALDPPAGDGPVVISDEQFYGLVWNGAEARGTTAERLARIFPGGRVILVLRNQPEQLQSLYLQYVKTGGTASPADFLSSKRHPLRLSPAYFRYASYVEHLRRLFGEPNVCVLLYEDMRADQEAFLGRLCEFLGVPDSGWDRGILGVRENVSLSSRLVTVMRLVNRLASSERNPFQLLPFRVQHTSRRALVRLSTRLPPGGPAIPVASAVGFLAECAADNRRLADLLGRDLEALGYPL